MLVDRITQQELAQISGTTLFTVNRTLTEWQEQGLWRLDARGLGLWIGNGWLASPREKTD